MTDNMGVKIGAYRKYYLVFTLGFLLLMSGCGIFSHQDTASGTMGTATKIADGDDSGFALNSSGLVWAWGYNYYGDLGNGSSGWPSKSSPGQVLAISSISSISARGDHALAVKSDGTVWAWGSNYWGKLGDGTTENRSIPVQVQGISDVTTVSAGSGFSLALKSDGTVWSWGGTYKGELGIGTSDVTIMTTPVQIDTLDHVIAIEAGDYHALALKSDGTVWSWGDNSYGQLGGGTDSSSNPTPNMVPGISNIVSIAAGGYHNLAVQSDGTVWAFGQNWSGQLGDGTESNRYSPVKISSFSGVVAVAGGLFHSLALKSDGTVWVWGHYYHSSPQVISDFSGVVAVSAGAVHSMALKSDGTVWCWGTNYYGHNGNGSDENDFVYVPVQVIH